MACRLTKKNGVFEKELYASLNQDEALLGEIMPCTIPPPIAARLALPAVAASLSLSPANLSRIKEGVLAIGDVTLPSPLK